MGKTILEKHYEKDKKGAMVLVDQEILDSQKGMLKDIIKEALSNFSFKHGFSDFSLPAKIFAKRTQLEIIPDLFANTQYLKQAVEAFNPQEPDENLKKQMRIERIKLITTFLVSGVYNSIQTKKPFNLYIGETFQAYFDDGTEFFLEHTNHYPAIDSFYIVNKKVGFKIYGAIKLLSK